MGSTHCIKLHLKRVDGTYFDVSDYSAVTFTCVDSGGSVKVTGAASFEDKVSGEVSYTFATTDLTAVFSGIATFTLTNAGGDVMELPVRNSLWIECTED